MLAESRESCEYVGDMRRAITNITPSTDAEVLVETDSDGTIVSFSGACIIFKLHLTREQTDKLRGLLPYPIDGDFKWA